MPVQHRTYTCDPDLEIIGSTVLSIVDNLASKSLEDIAIKHGLVNIQMDEWYPAQKVFDFFTEVERELGPQTFVAMGMKVAEIGEYPPDLATKEDTLRNLLEGWAEFYTAHHRGADFPNAKTVKLSDTHYHVHFKHDNLYPFNFPYGIAYGFAKILLPKGKPFTVRYLDGHSPDEIDQEDVIIEIKW